MPFFALVALMAALAPPPYAKLTVIARGRVCPLVLKRHVDDLKEAALVFARSRRAVGPSDAYPMDVVIRRLPLEEDQEAAITTSMIFAMTAGGAAW